jgi:hypothetical protein
VNGDRKLSASDDVSEWSWLPRDDDDHHCDGGSALGPPARGVVTWLWLCCCCCCWIWDRSGDTRGAARMALRVEDTLPLLKMYTVQKSGAPFKMVVGVGTLNTGYPAYKFQVKIKGETCKSHTPTCG